jgi:acyl-CoA reductase-like NAD-dependent aldehyde dehydrogenase
VAQPAEAPVVVIHSQAHAVAALAAAAEAGRPVILASAPDAGIYGGPGWWGGLIAGARAAVPTGQAAALLDCGDDAGAAQAAIRAGIEAIVFTGPAEVARRLVDIARQRGCRLVHERPAAALDLGAAFFASPEQLRRSCAEHLSR